MAEEIPSPPQQFQSTPPHGGRHGAGRPRGPPRPRFNPRPRTGGDGYLQQVNPEQYDDVSIHAPARGATIQRSACLLRPQFQSTPPHGGRRVPRDPVDRWCDRFNPRPRTGGDTLVWVPDATRRLVSIHAPARGATPSTGGPCGGRRVSIHAPARGATYSKRWSGMRFPSFNPRPRTGGDGAIISVKMRGVYGAFYTDPLEVHLKRLLWFLGQRLTADNSGFTRNTDPPGISCSLGVCVSDR